MEPRTLTSAQNPIAQRFRRVARGGGRKDGVFLLEGRHVFEEAKRVGWPLEVVLVDRREWPRWKLALRSLRPEPICYMVPGDLLERLGTAATSQGVLGLGTRMDPEDPVPSRGELYLFLDRVQDPVNVGMLIRSAVAFGAAGVFAGTGTADPYHPTAMARSAGAVLHLPPLPRSHAGFLEWVRRSEVNLIGARAGGAPPAPLGAHAPPAALALGNEGSGLSAELAAACGDTVAIPMREGWDSLNVAVAGSVLLRDLLRGEFEVPGRGTENRDL